MASVFKRGRWVDANGRKCTKDTSGAKWVESRFWTVQYFLNGKPKTIKYELVDRYDEERGISAMMRTTGYSLSITGQMQARGEVQPPGVHTPDECMPGQKYIAELAKRGINIRIT